MATPAPPGSRRAAGERRSIGTGIRRAGVALLLVFSFAISLSLLSGLDPTPFLTAMLLSWCLAVHRPVRLVACLVGTYLGALVALHVAMFYVHAQPLEWLFLSSTALTALFATELVLSRRRSKKPVASVGRPAGRWR